MLQTQRMDLIFSPLYIIAFYRLQNRRLRKARSSCDKGAVPLEVSVSQEMGNRCLLLKHGWPAAKYLH